MGWVESRGSQTAAQAGVLLSVPPEFLMIPTSQKRIRTVFQQRVLMMSRYKRRKQMVRKTLALNGVLSGISPVTDPFFNDFVAIF